MCDWSNWVADGKDKMRVATWAEHWVQLLTDPRFQQDCPTIHLLARIVAVSLHGSVEDERMFSQLNFVKNDLRSRLTQAHMHAALRLRTERGKSTGKIFERSSDPWGELWTHWSTDFEGLPSASNMWICNVMAAFTSI